MFCNHLVQLFYTLILALAAAILLTITRNKFGGKVRVAIGFLWIWSSISGIFITSQLLLGASGTGVTADLVPGVASLQNRLGIMQEQIEAVRVNTEEIKEATARIESSLDSIWDDIQEIGQLGGIQTIPGELFAKFQTSFYSDPIDAVFKAIGIQ
jgi:hypothetical protein